MPVYLGPYPLCQACREINGGLFSARHRQVHLRAHGKEACVDHGLIGLLTSLWSVCDTRSCCQDDGGRAYVVPTLDTSAAAVDMLSALGLRPRVREGIVWFDTSTSLRLDDVGQVRRALEEPHGGQLHWRVHNGRFELVGSVDPSAEKAIGT